MNQGYLLNFVIPQGPTGPTGSASGLSAYGGRYNNTASTISLGITTPSQIPLSSTMPNVNITYPATNSITINQGGVYEINYYVNLSVNVATTLTLAVRNNGTNIPTSIITRVLSVGANSIYSGSFLVSLNANSVIDMAMSALVATNVTLGSGVNASLTVKKIS